jgi:hypothetical protein
MATVQTITSLPNSYVDVGVEHYVRQTVVNMAGGAADVETVHIGAAASLIAWGFIVTVAVIATTTPPQVSLDLADYDGATNRVEQDTIIVPDTTAVGNTAFVWHEFTPVVDIAEGRCFIFEHKIQCVGGAIAGSGRAVVLYRYIAT